MSKILTKRISSLLTNYEIISTVFLTTILISGFIIFQPLQINAQNKTATIIPDAIKLTKCELATPPTDPDRYEYCYFQGYCKNHSC